jgi:hypothetical protein
LVTRECADIRSFVDVPCTENCAIERGCYEQLAIILEADQAGVEQVIDVGRQH